MPSIQENAQRVLSYLAVQERDRLIAGEQIAKDLRLDPDAVNDAVALLVDRSLAEWQRWFGTKPFEFGAVEITSRGRYEADQSPAANRATNTRSTVHKKTVPSHQGKRVRTMEPNTAPARAQSFAGTLPVGTPYGFLEQDWEVVEARRTDVNTLFVVLGHKWKSKHFNTPRLRANVARMFADALATHNASSRVHKATLQFRALAAGYGEHVFNKITRDIISADIAVFETSDLNPNVMMEMGIALTYGVRVLPIKKVGQPEPPSDISGQTWAEYRNSGSVWISGGHADELVDMVRRAVSRKSRG